MRRIWRRVPLAPAKKETTLQHIYPCTRCGTGWLATLVEPRGQGWAVHVFVCSHCQYASQPGVPLAVQGGAGTLPVRVHAALIPVARLTGPGVETLQLAEIFTLLGLRPDAPRGEARRPVRALQAARLVSSLGGRA
jgi:hypothetical protein